jgi:hypothetical protein
LMIRLQPLAAVCLAFRRTPFRFGTGLRAARAVHETLSP